MGDARLDQPLRQHAVRSTAEHPLSHGQQALWFLHQLAPASPAYNLVYTTRLPADTNLTWLRHALLSLVGRHAALRTTYGLRDGRPTQIVHATSPIDALCTGRPHRRVVALRPSYRHGRLVVRRRA